LTAQFQAAGNHLPLLLISRARDSSRFTFTCEPSVQISQRTLTLTLQRRKRRAPLRVQNDFGSFLLIVNASFRFRAASK
jgi:hypothetical protein